jgi:hypothetical protein
MNCRGGDKKEMTLCAECRVPMYTIPCNICGDSWRDLYESVLMAQAFVLGQRIETHWRLAQGPVPMDALIHLGSQAALEVWAEDLCLT